MSDIKYKEGLDSIINGINKTVDAVKSTFGPNGNTVFIKDRNKILKSCFQGNEMLLGCGAADRNKI